MLSKKTTRSVLAMFLKKYQKHFLSFSDLTIALSSYFFNIYCINLQLIKLHFKNISHI